MALTAREALDRTILLARQRVGPEASDQDIVAGLQGTTVCIVADEVNATNPVGQSAMCTLAGLVLACGMQVRVVAPEVLLVGRQPPVVGDALVSGLIELGHDTVPGASVVADRVSRRGDLVFLIGNTGWQGDARHAWRLHASAWEGGIGPVDVPVALEDQFPLGALAAAASAAAEPFRDALRTVAARTRCSVPEPRLLAMTERLSTVLAPPGTPTSPLDLGRLDFVSGGAIVSACLHALLRVSDLEAGGRVWEPQALDGSNLNRYMLARRSQLEQLKVSALQFWAIGSGVRISPYAEFVTQDVIRAAAPLAPQVIVGTDNVEARWLVQAAWPTWLGVGGTAGFMVLVSEHTSGTPCAGCLHPIAEPPQAARLPIPTVSFVSYWAGLLLAARVIRYRTAGSIALDSQATLAWVDRLDGRHAWLDHRLSRDDRCPVDGRSTMADFAPG